MTEVNLINISHSCWIQWSISLRVFLFLCVVVCQSCGQKHYFFSQVVHMFIHLAFMAIIFQEPVEGIFFKFGSNIHLDSKMSWTDCYDPRSKVTPTREKHVFGCNPRIYMLIISKFHTNFPYPKMMTGWHLLGQRSTPLWHRDHLQKTFFWP